MRAKLSGVPTDLLKQTKGLIECLTDRHKNSPDSQHWRFGPLWFFSKLKCRRRMFSVPSGEASRRSRKPCMPLAVLLGGKALGLMPKTLTRPNCQLDTFSELDWKETFPPRLLSNSLESEGHQGLLCPSSCLSLHSSSHSVHTEQSQPTACKAVLETLGTTVHALAILFRGCPVEDGDNRQEEPAELVMLCQEPTRTWNREKGQPHQGRELRPSGEVLSEADISGND